MRLAADTKNRARFAAVGIGLGVGSWTLRHCRSAAVQAWTPSHLDVVRAGPLHVRTGGSTGPVVVLLHGLVANGDIFGAPFDSLAESSTLVVPDLLGFGRSLDEQRSSFTADEHLDALDAMLEDLGLTHRSLIIGAHSMGVALAVRWAARHGARCEAVVGFGAPVYPDAAAVHDTIADTGLMARAFVANTRWAQAACRLNCRHRRIAGLFAAAAAPELPTCIARAASLHTWPAYRDAIDDVISATDWSKVLTELAADGTSVELVWGSEDRIGDRSFAATLPGASVAGIDNADHHLPLTHPTRCVERLASHLLTF